MKSIRLIPFLAAAGLAIATSARGDIIVQENFAYPAGSQLAATTPGGSGTWQGPWIVAGNPVVTADGLRIGDGTANPSPDPTKLLKIAKRPFAKYNGDIVYVKFVFSTGAGTTTNADRFGLFLPSYEHGALLIGTGLTGAGSEKADNQITARCMDTSKARITSPAYIASETTYTVIAEWSKSVSGPGEPYNRLRMWVNPKAEDLASAAYKEMSFEQLRPAIGYVGFYLAESDAGDVFVVRNVTLATTWQEVIAP